jgi:aspartyl-tRNA(Asn)/glutamyl-tRNA(Gln) amidotransferase subunit C
MPLDEEQAVRIAHLARLAIDGEDARRYARDLTRILGLVQQMNEVDTEDVVPMAHPLEMHQRLRDDAVTEDDQREKLQACAPAVRDGLYLVPRVVE